MQASFDPQGRMVVHFENDGRGDFFVGKNKRVYRLVSKINVASVNSQIWQVTLDTGLEGTEFVLKVSALTSESDELYFENKLQIYKKLSKLKNRPITVPKLNADGTFYDMQVKVSDVMMTSLESGIFITNPSSPGKMQHKCATKEASCPLLLGGVKIGYVIEPYINDFVDFEGACISWSNLSAEELAMRVKFVLKTIVEILRGMLQYGFNHNDCHLRNIMVNKGTGTVMLIDYDWSTFHDPNKRLQPMSAQVIMMGSKYFKKMREFVSALAGSELDALCEEEEVQECFETVAGKMFNTLSSMNLCTMLHYFIHAKYSLSYYLKEEPSPSVDFAKCCIDFYKKFIGIAGCSLYDTEFKETQDVLRIRQALKSQELPAMIEAFYGQQFDVTTIK